MFVQNFKIQGAVVPEKTLIKYFIKGKDKWINKRNDKHEDADSVLHHTSSSTQCLGRGPQDFEQSWQRPIRWSHTKYQRPGPSGFKEDFLSFSLREYVKQMSPWVGPFFTPGL